MCGCYRNIQNNMRFRIEKGNRFGVSALCNDRDLYWNKRDKYTRSTVHLVWFSHSVSVVQSVVWQQKKMRRKSKYKILCALYNFVRLCESHHSQTSHWAHAIATACTDTNNSCLNFAYTPAHRVVFLFEFSVSVILTKYFFCCLSEKKKSSDWFPNI